MTASYEYLGPGNTHYSAICPDHGRKTSNWQGTDSGGMLFRCPETKDHYSHIFRVKQPRGLPKRVEDIAAWEKAQVEAKLKNMKGSQ